MKIGNINIKNKVALAPMAGISDRAFREICKKFGAGFTVSEMVSAKAICFSDKKTHQLLENSQKEHPFGIQLFGNEPKIMAKAASLITRYDPNFIDINMGCPAPKVNKSGAGAALMLNPELCTEIVSYVKNAVEIPVSVKFRKGWDEENINAPLLAQICQQNGADFITIHGKTREQMYKPGVDLELIRQIKSNVNIPVVANGEINSTESAKKMLEHTNCNMLMLGRAAFGNPFIFEEINAGLKGKKYIPPTPGQRMQVMLEHIALMLKYKGEKIGIKEARSHVMMYLKGVKGAASLRNKASRIETFKDVINIAEEFLKNQD